MADMVEVEMTVDTYNTDMGGRLRSGNVYSMATEYADHLKAKGFAKTPTKTGRNLTEQTLAQENAELKERLARLTGDGNYMNSITAENVGGEVPPAPVESAPVEPAPVEPAPAPEGPPVVLTSATRRRAGLPGMDTGSDITEGTPSATDEENKK